MARNFLNLRTELLSRLRTSTNVISATRSGAWLNDAQQDVANEFDFDHLENTESLSTVASTSKYYLKFGYGKIISVIDQSNQQEVTYRSRSDIEVMDPDLSQTGTPYHWHLQGWSYVRAQPTSASVITAVSSSASDTSQKVRLVGRVSGEQDTELLTLNGTTDVVGTKSFTQIDGAYKDTATTGRVTVTSNSAAVTVAQFAPASLVDENQPMLLWPVPSGVITMQVRGFRQPRDMINDQDMPDMPSAFHDLVLLRATVIGQRDLYRPELARDLEEREYFPELARLRKQEGLSRYRRSQVIGGSANDEQYWGGRLPSVLVD